MTLGAALALAEAPGDASAQEAITFIEVSLDEETRRADDKLRRYLRQATGLTFVSERPMEYGAAFNRMAGWQADRGYFIARVTPFTLVAAEVLGAGIEPIATYVSAATQSTTYSSYFVVNRARFPRVTDLHSLVDELKRLPRPATFAYHSRFSTSSYFLPALFFRDNRIYNMPASTDFQTAIHSQAFGTSSTELVRAVADGQFDLAAVWDGTRNRFLNTDSLRERYGTKVEFLQLPTIMPNDLLVVSSAMDSLSRRRIRDAVRQMSATEIGIGDFVTWQEINSSPEARQALANLRWLARELPRAVTVDVRKSSKGPPVSDAILDAARQAVRLSGAEFVLFDEDFHAHADYIWTLQQMHDGAVLLTSRIMSSDLDDQEFQISFKDPEDLAHRIGARITSRIHRIRYVWPYRTERPTVIRDVGFSLPAESAVKVKKINWINAQRNFFSEDAEFEARVSVSDFFKFELEPNFISDETGDFGFDPLSTTSYRVVLVRTDPEPRLFRALTAAFVILLTAAAIAAVMAVRQGGPPGSVLAITPPAAGHHPESSGYAVGS